MIDEKVHKWVIVNENGYERDRPCCNPKSNNNYVLSGKWERVTCKKCLGLTDKPTEGNDRR